MKRLIILSILLTNWAWATTPFESWPCHAQLKKLSTEWKSSETWEKHFIGGQKEHFFAATTPVVGEWVLARQTSKGVALAKVQQTGRIEARFEGAKCEKKIIPVTEAAPAKELFSDKDLKQFIDKNKTGVIYVWSPRMGLSERGLVEIQKASVKKKLPLLVLMNKDVSAAEMEKLKKKLGDKFTRRVDSFEFKMRNVDQHFPAIMVFKQGQIKSGIKYGYENAQNYSSDIDQLLR